MESFLSRFRNVIVLVIVLSAQTVLLATQIKRPKDPQRPEVGSTRLIRLWAVEIFVPLQHAFTATGHFFGNAWHGYIDLRGVRQQNHQLQDQLDRLRLEEIRLAEDAGQARRLQALLSFKEQYISQTLAAQVVGTSGTERSRIFYIDKGSNDGLRTDLPVITPTGIVGKISRVFPNTAQVLAISDPQSGAGVMLEKSRIRGVLRGTATGYPEIIKSVMSDEKVDRGELVLTSGGDQIYPRGMAVGTVDQVVPDREGEPFLTLRVRPAADLNRLEEVLVITKVEEKQTQPSETSAIKLRAADILAERLPKVIPKPAPEAGSANATKPASSGGAAVVKTPAKPVSKPVPSPGNAAQPVGDTSKKLDVTAGTATPETRPQTEPAAPAKEPKNPEPQSPKTTPNPPTSPEQFPKTDTPAVEVPK